jgi:hypothetical protein
MIEEWTMIKLIRRWIFRRKLLKILRSNKE